MELGSRKPELESFGVSPDVGVEDFREDVFAHFAQKGLNLEGRVHFAEFFDDAGAFVFGKEARYAIRDDAGGGDEGIFRFIVG